MSEFMNELKSLFDSLSFLKIAIVAFFGSGFLALIYLFTRDLVNML